MATDGGDEYWRNVLQARSVTVYPATGDPVDLQTYLDGLGAGEITIAWADVTGKPASYPPSSHTHPAAQISDATAVGRSVLTAADAAGARTALGAGTSSLALGTTGTTAAAGNHTHTGLMTGAAQAVADSAATDVAGLVADVNALLAALRSRGVIA